MNNTATTGGSGIKLPPFGKALKQDMEAGRYPTSEIRLFIGGRTAWAEAMRWQHFRDVLVLPEVYDEYNKKLPPVMARPSEYWWPVLGCDVLAKWMRPAEGDVVRELVESLLMWGASLVVILGPDPEAKMLACERVQSDEVQ